MATPQCQPCDTKSYRPRERQATKGNCFTLKIFAMNCSKFLHTKINELGDTSQPAFGNKGLRSQKEGTMNSTAFVPFFLPTAL